MRKLLVAWDGFEKPLSKSSTGIGRFERIVCGVYCAHDQIAMDKIRRVPHGSAK